MLIFGTFLFEITTKNKEFHLIFSGNRAAAFSLGGRIVGLAIVIQSSIANSISLIDMLIWGIIAIVFQILSFYLLEWITPTFNVTKAIDEDNIATGMLLFFISISIGFVLAGSLTY